MIKVLGYIFLAIIIGGGAYFFLRTPEYSLKGLTLEDDLFIEGVVTPTDEGIVENLKLINFIKKEVSDLRSLVDKRKLECETNAQDFFNQDLKVLLDESRIIKNIDFVFKNTLDRKYSEEMFVKLREVIAADVTLKPGRIKKVIKSLEICRPKISLDYIHQVLDATKKYPKSLKKKITYDMAKNLNLILLGEQHSFTNIKLAFTYLVQMEELGLIKGKKENQMRNIKMELDKSELIYLSHLGSVKNNKELISYNKKYMKRLNIFSNNLKISLGAFSK
jgi:hypothetical protein